MFFSYTASVILLSLAIFGLWCLAVECWQWYIRPRVLHLPGVSFLFIVKNMEQEIEQLIRSVLREMEGGSLVCEAVVVDAGSDDLTPRILAYLAGESPLLKVVHLPQEERPVGKALPICEGEAVYVYDMVNRMEVQECLAAVHEVLSRR
ncbi:MAG: glycosyltransferase [Sporomusaceae bacterium]|nr:glycosyltransferase [Sporomusaceae bacterium]